MRELLFREGHLSISERKKLEVLKTNYRPKKRPRQRFPNPLFKSSSSSLATIAFGAISTN